ncbi:MAG: DUF5684 domain-containing protein [Lachnospiraceae bacterium]
MFALDELLTYMFTGAWLAVWITVYVLLVIANWKIFEKAGEPGWMSLIPILNSYIFFKITWGNGWFFLLTLIPFIGWIFYVIAEYHLCQAFDKGIGFFFGLFFLPNLFTLILGFGASTYHKPYAV